jgi:hypothetical protein
MSPDAVAGTEVGLGRLATPLEAGGFDGRWVMMGLLPWVHAF